LAVLRRQGDADADADMDVLITDCDRFAHDLDQPAGESRGRCRLIGGQLQHGEFVAAQSRHDVGFAGGAAQPGRRDAQQFVAAVMAERVVHRLEVIEIKTQHGEAAAAVE